MVSQQTHVVAYQRKFLVTGDAWRDGQSSDYRQGYLSIDKQRTVRVRVANNAARLTAKGITEGATRAEFEYPIPVSDAKIILDTLCLRPLIEKRRFRIEHQDMTWEVDEFIGENAGLVAAEIELKEEHQPFDKPCLVGEEVTGDSRFYNANLVTNPYSSWGKPPVFD